MRASSTRRKIIFLRVAITVGVVALLLGAMAILLPLLRARNFARHFDSMQAIERDLYRIYTEEGDPLGPLTAREINRFLVNLYAEWGGADRLDLVSTGGPGFPIVILLLGNEERLREYHGARYRGVDMRYNAGMYEPVAGTISLISDRRADSAEFRRGLYHEATHMVLDRLVAGRDHAWSWWLNEGLATYLEASRDPSGIGFQLGGTSRRYLGVVASLPDADVREVLTYDGDSFRGRGNSRAYAMSSVFVAFLLEGADLAYHDRFWRYVERERERGDIPNGVLEATLGVPLAELNRPFQAFVRTRLGGE